MRNITFNLGFEEYRADPFLLDTVENETPLTEMQLGAVLRRMDRPALLCLVLELSFSDHVSFNSQRYSDSELIGWVLRKVEHGRVAVFKKEQDHYRPPSKPRKRIPPSPPLQKTKPAVRARIKEDEPEKAEVNTLNDRRGIPSKSLEDANDRLESMKGLIHTNGYQPKYSDAELLQQVQTGDISQERFHVRVIEKGHKYHRDDTIKNPNNLTGALGVTMQGETSRGAKYWSTTFDQLEDADKDPRLICEKLGLDYDENKSYELAIIDTKKAKPLAKTKSVPATFEKVAKVSNEELPKKFPKEFTDEVMNAEFQAAYALHHANAVRSGALEGAWDTDLEKFADYLESTDLSEKDKKVMLKRMKMHDTIGNNQYYVGNGLTENKIGKNKTAPCSNLYGAVETLNVERKEINLQQFIDARALKLVKLG